jgi:transposase
MKITRVGLDLAKNVVQVHGVDRTGNVVVRKRLSRGKVLEYFAGVQPCLIGMEASGGAHQWARELAKLGHTVKMMAPKYVSPYRKGGKNDGQDADAICEAVGRPNMRFVPVKSLEQQALLTVHRTRQLVVGQRTALINQARGLLAEFGIVLAKGPTHVRRRLPEILEDAQNGLPALVREVLAEIRGRLVGLDETKVHYDRKLSELVKNDERARRVMELQGIGEITASAAVATMGDGSVFRNGRHFAAWLGVTPRQHSSGERQRLGAMTKHSDPYLRTLFIHGARSAIASMMHGDDPRSRWVQRLVERRGKNRAAVALAAKNARIVWAMVRHEKPYRPAMTAV